MALQTSGLVVLARIHRRLEIGIHGEAVVALLIILRQRKEREALRPAPLHRTAGRRMSGPAELRGAIGTAVADRAAVVEQWMRRGRTDVGLQLRVRAEGVHDL